MATGGLEDSALSADFLQLLQREIQVVASESGGHLHAQSVGALGDDGIGEGDEKWRASRAMSRSLQIRMRRSSGMLRLR